jgi:hypothetical protein
MPHITHHHLSGLLMAAALSAGSVHARAEAPSDEASASAAEASAQAVLDERATRAQVWQYGWGGFGYALAASFGTLAIATDDKDTRLDFAFAAGGIFVGTTMHMIDSIRPHAAAHAREKPGSARAELKAAAEAEEKRRSLVFGHLLPAGFATAAGLVLWLGFDHLGGAVVNTAAAVIANEAGILTLPTSASRAYRDSTKQLPEGSSAAAGPSWQLTFWGTGAGVVGSF